MSAFSIRLFAVIRFESIIHEFDPYFNYRTTKFMTENGIYNFHNWFDIMAWYPLGRIVGGTIYPEIHDTGAGLVAAGLIAVVPGYISRSVAGSYDNEGIAIFCMLFTFFCWIKSVKTGAIKWGAICSLAYFYMALGIFGLCQIMEFFSYLRSKLTSNQFNKLIRTAITLIGSLFGAAIVVLMLSGKIAPWTGRFYSLLDPTYAKNHIPIIASVAEHQPTAWASYFMDLQFLTVLFPVGIYYCFRQLTDSNIFLIAYALTSVYFSGVMVRLMLVLAPAMCIVGSIAVSNLLKSFLPNSKGLFDKSIAPPPPSVKSANASGGSKHAAASNYPFKEEVSTFMVVILLLMLVFYAQHCVWVTSTSYSHPSIVLESSGPSGQRYILDDYREAYYWLRQNTRPDARVMSWWDYGYQITAIANRTVLVDNNTWNNTHIGRVGQAMASSEEEAYEIMQELDVDYVLVIFGGMLGYSSDDINKFIWMVRIAGSTEKGKHVDESNYYTRYGEMRVDEEASETMRNCLMYKLSYYRFWEMRTERC